MQVFKEKYSIRVLNVKSNFTEDLIRELSKHQIGSNLFKNSNGSYNIVIEITEEIDKTEKIIKALEQFGIESDNINLFISFTTNNEVSGFTVSKQIVELIKKYFDSIDVSIVFLDV